jgi:hypothetical protein
MPHRRESSHKPLFDPPKSRGSVVAVSPLPPLPAPVIYYDTRHHDGGTSDLLNLGTAGAVFDLPIEDRSGGPWTGDWWAIKRYNYFAQPDSGSSFPTGWDDLGGPPTTAAFLMVTVLPSTILTALRGTGVPTEAWTGSECEWFFTDVAGDGIQVGVGSTYLYEDTGNPTMFEGFQESFWDVAFAGLLYQFTDIEAWGADNSITDPSNYLFGHYFDAATRTMWDFIYDGAGGLTEFEHTFTADGAEEFPVSPPAPNEWFEMEDDLDAYGGAVAAEAAETAMVRMYWGIGYHAGPSLPGLGTAWNCCTTKGLWRPTSKPTLTQIHEIWLQATTPYVVPIPTGGTITTDGGYTYHTFTADGTFDPNGYPAPIERFAIAGGAAGGDPGSERTGGGGGNGEYDVTTGVITVPEVITIGPGGTVVPNSNGSSGGPTVIVGATTTTLAGGAGGGANGSGTANGSSGVAGGGGGQHGGTGGGGVHSGGNGYNSGGADNFGAGGGGGAAANGGNAQSSTSGHAGDGGAGVEWPAGSGDFYGDGGPGGAQRFTGTYVGGTAPHSGAVGATDGPDIAAVAPAANTGSGGAGGAFGLTATPGAAGRVVYRYPTP